MQATQSGPFAQLVLPAMVDIEHVPLAERIQKKIDNKTKPLGSLGTLESVALQIGLILGTDSPALELPQLLVCAGDHGLAARGVSAYPSEVTAQMVENLLGGGAAASVIARQHNVALTVVDCGVKSDIAVRRHLSPMQPKFIFKKIAYGTADSFVGAAMTDAQCIAAIRNGQAIVRQLPGNSVLLGEMGIGNTSAASMLLARIADVAIAECTGSGTGLSHRALASKIDVLDKVLKLHLHAKTPLEALAAFGGFEIATLVGIVIEAAAERRVIVVDGFITTAAVVVASALDPLILQRCIFSHRSAERGHSHMLEHLGARPLLDIGLRLGEGSAALAAWPMLQSAVLLLNEMASFDEAGVSRQH